MVQAEKYADKAVEKDKYNPHGWFSCQQHVYSNVCMSMCTYVSMCILYVCKYVYTLCM